MIVSVIYSHIDGVADALIQLERHFGRVRCETIDIPCTSTDRYSEEMGSSLHRRFFSFEKRADRDRLPEIKLCCHKIEKELGDRVNDFTFRTVNLDPGIMTADNLVMASHREYNHRIYLTRGVFAELALVWARGQFVRLPWTPADFYHDEAVEFFHRVRQSFDCIGEAALDPAKIA